MAANTSPIFPLTPIVATNSLVSATPITTGANITGTAGLALLVPTSTNGTRVDNITVRAQGTTVASTVYIWINDGTTSRLFDQIDIAAVTATTTVDSAYVSRGYTALTLPPTYTVYISQTVATNVNVFAFGGTY